MTNNQTQLIACFADQSAFFCTVIGHARSILRFPMSFEFVLTAEHDTGALRIGVVTLNRANQLNALSDALMDELGTALRAFDADDGVGCIIITGSERAFAAGADISTMARMDFEQAYKSDLISRNGEALCEIRKPVIAAVAGLALGGGCELAMMCDFIIAADNARFGQPEVKLAVIPGAGGTQRLPRAVGKSKAMDMMLTARTMNAEEAERAGLVSCEPNVEADGRVAVCRRSHLLAEPAQHPHGQGVHQPRVRDAACRRHSL
jgi:enoyl-CoA hydratase